MHCECNDRLLRVLIQRELDLVQSNSWEPVHLLLPLPLTSHRRPTSPLHPHTSLQVDALLTHNMQELLHTEHLVSAHTLAALYSPHWDVGTPADL